MFTPAEGLELAKAWVRQSEKGSNQNGCSMREEIAEFRTSQFGFTPIPSLLKSKWKNL